MVRRLFVLGILFGSVSPPDAQAQVRGAAIEGSESQSEAPRLTLRTAIEEAVQRNPELIALRREYEAARAAPAQERFLAPPMLEAQIWGWPVTTTAPPPANPPAHAGRARGAFVSAIGQEVLVLRRDQGGAVQREVSCAPRFRAIKHRQIKLPQQRQSNAWTSPSVRSRTRRERVKTHSR